ncbi:hypothetical protein MMC25_005684 [Agyrium rufum]|nr:hypothetical protein [Agyrium rufum]
MALPRKIDVHHHVFPQFFSEAMHRAGGDPAKGFTNIKWSPEQTLEVMASQNADFAMLSLSAPGATVLKDLESSRALARQTNEYIHSLRKSQPSKFGFMAHLPDALADPEGTLAEIAHAFDVLHADGTILFTRYGKENTYLGNAVFEPIWKALDERKAAVLVHPTALVDTRLINPALIQPAIDYPHETARAAFDMIINGVKRRYPNVRVILPHAGGTLPVLVDRVAGLIPPAFGDKVPTSEEIIEDAKSFYFDLALSGSANVLDGFLRWAPMDRVLYGSDYPYVSAALGGKFVDGLDEYEMEEGIRRRIYRENAMAMWPRLRDVLGKD